MKKNKGKCAPMVNLKVMRVKNGLTLEALAERAGLNYNTISQYENGIHSPRHDNLKKIAAVLGCDVKDII